MCACAYIGTDIHQLVTNACVHVRYMCTYINFTSGLVFHFRTQFTPRRSRICVYAYKNVPLRVCSVRVSSLGPGLRSPSCRTAGPALCFAFSTSTKPAPWYRRRLLLGGRPHPRRPSTPCRAFPAESPQTHSQSPRAPASRRVPSAALSTPEPPELSLPPLPEH